MPLVTSPASYHSPLLPVPQAYSPKSHGSPNGNANGGVLSLNSPAGSKAARMASPSTSPLSNHSARIGGYVNGHDGESVNGTQGHALLIPTDRPLEELEDRWLPRLGKLRVREEIVLQGYSLYAVRTWYLSRTHWSQTIVTQTGKPTEHISVYVIVPASELSERQGEAEITKAIDILVKESHAHQRKTESGAILVTTPTAFGQDVFPIPGGDLREMKPYLIVNTDLRRLGCGGRAAMGMESPVPAVRRKFFELYRLPTPPAAPSSRANSPTTSPVKPSNVHSPVSPSRQAIATDPFTHMLVELVKLIQSALRMWGLIGDEVDVDGLFCDQTKKAVFEWRRIMGMEHEESMRMEKETSGGCIDPKTLSALLSSITSVRYQLDALGAEKVPKDPFASPRRFLDAWKAYQHSFDSGGDRVSFLTVTSIRHLNQHYLNERTRYPDAFKVHRLLFSSVASATSSLHANLKGGAAEEAPVRKREHHLRFRHDNGSHEAQDAIRRGSHSTNGEPESGLGMIIQPGEITSVAPPDIITSDLEAYTKGILKSREKDWDVMGARRIAGLWSGHFDKLRYKQSQRRLDKSGVWRSSRQSTMDGQMIAEGSHDEAQGASGARGALGKAGQALKGGFGLVGRRTGTYETSDSDTGGPGPTSLRHALQRRKQTTIPTVVEPDVEEEEQNNGQDQAFFSSPSPSNARLQGDRGNGVPSRYSAFSSASHGRPSLITSLSNDGSDTQSKRSQPYSFADDRWNRDRTRPANGKMGVAERAFAWRERGRATAMLRTASDGADVVLEEGGMEWEVVEPHGTGRGRQGQDAKITRRHSLQDRFAYRMMEVLPADHLAVDVEMCALVRELRQRERQLAKKADETKALETSVYEATQVLIDVERAKRQDLEAMQLKVRTLEADLKRTVDGIDDDETLQWANEKIQFYLSEDTNTNEIMWNLRELEKEWQNVRKKLGRHQGS